MAMVSGFFGLVAVLLATVGLFGVISHLVARRRKEIGIRMALGANAGQVVGMMARDAGWLLVIGLAVGIGLALLAARAAGSLLFGLAPHDPGALVAACGLMALIAAGATAIPARRAVRMDPMGALREE